MLIDVVCAMAWPAFAVRVKLFGERLVGPPVPNMAGEDFAFFLHRKPGAFFFVGSNPDAAFALDPAMYEFEPCSFSS